MIKCQIFKFFNKVAYYNKEKEIMHVKFIYLVWVNIRNKM